MLDKLPMLQPSQGPAQEQRKQSVDGNDQFEINQEKESAETLIDVDDRERQDKTVVNDTRRSSNSSENAGYRALGGEKSQISHDRIQKAYMLHGYAAGKET
jgi:hypothetical protein